MFRLSVSAIVNRILVRRESEMGEASLVTDSGLKYS
jgi:hypothetical protein